MGLLPPALAPDSELGLGLLPPALAGDSGIGLGLLPPALALDSGLVGLELLSPALVPDSGLAGLGLLVQDSGRPLAGQWADAAGWGLERAPWLGLVLVGS